MASSCGWLRSTVSKAGADFATCPRSGWKIEAGVTLDEEAHAQGVMRGVGDVTGVGNNDRGFRQGSDFNVMTDANGQVIRLEEKLDAIVQIAARKD